MKVAYAKTNDFTTLKMWNMCTTLEAVFLFIAYKINWNAPSSSQCNIFPFNSKCYICKAWLKSINKHRSNIFLQQPVCPCIDKFWCMKFYDGWSCLSTNWQMCFHQIFPNLISTEQWKKVIAHIIIIIKFENESKIEQLVRLDSTVAQQHSSMANAKWIYCICIFFCLFQCSLYIARACNYNSFF